MKKNFLGRGVALLLVILMLAGCASVTSGDTTGATVETTLPVPDQTIGSDNETAGAVTGEGVTFFSVNLSTTETEIRYLLAYPNDDGTVYVEYVGEEKKVGNAMDAQVLERITEAVTESGMAALNGKDAYEDGFVSGSAYIQYADGAVIGYGFSGTAVPQEYFDAYEKLDACFRAVTADLEAYVPVPMVMDGVDEAALTELLAILEETHIQDLDMFQISDVPVDDLFAMMMGLSSAEGIAKGTSCTAMMMTTPYSLVIATLEDGADVDRVRNDFINNLDWQKWVCVMPTGALVAQKGNMVLCLMGADRLYQQTVQAVADCGWDRLEAIDSPFA